MAFERNIAALPFNEWHREKEKSAMQKALNFSSLQASPYRETKAGKGVERSRNMIKRFEHLRKKSYW